MDEVEVVSRKTMAVFEDFLVATIPVLEHGSTTSFARDFIL
jgi:hypothetical protein